MCNNLALICSERCKLFRFNRSIGSNRAFECFLGTCPSHRRGSPLNLAGRIEGQIVKLIGSAFIGFVASYIIGIALPPLVLAVITIAAISLIFHRNPGQFRGA